MRTVHGAAGAVLFLLFLVAWLELGSTPRTADIVLASASVAVPAVAAVFAGSAARSAQGRVRSGWIALSVALGCATVGEALWASRDLLGVRLTFPSAADAAYLTFLFGVVVAVLVFPVAGGGYQLRGRLVLDGIVMAASLFIVSWVTVMRQVVMEGTPTRPVLLAALAYPVLNLVALTVTAVALARSGFGQRRMLTLLTWGLFCMTMAESVFAYLSVSGPLNVPYLVELVWLTGMLLILLGTVEGRWATFTHRLAEPPGWASVWLPYAPFMLAAVVIAPLPRTVVLEAPVVITGLILLPAVLIRQFLAVSESQRLVATVTEQALHDPLTGLPNRALFNERLEQAGSLARGDGTSVGVLLLDLDDFKMVNDTLGHACGDELLVAAAARLTVGAGPEAAVARLGGDEFAAIVAGPVEEISATAERLVSSFDEPFVLAGHELRLRPTVGLALSDGGALPAAELLERADTAMYAGKRSRAGGVHSFVDGMAGQRTSQDGGYGSLRMLSELRGAVDNGDLALVYRPQVDLRTGRVVSLEALLRWPHPDRGLLPPDRFLPLVRSHGMIGPVTDFVIQRALDDAKHWKRNGIEVWTAVNLFAPCLHDSGLAARVGAALSQRGIRPEMLTLEITEDLPIGRDARAGRVLSELRESGIRIAVDDFGSGYSALADICQLPVDEIKLGEEFTAGFQSDPKVTAVVRSVTSLAGELGLVTVAEGVRTDDTAKRLLDVGCDFGQGDHFGPPLPPGEVPRFVAGSLPSSPG